MSRNTQRREKHEVERLQKLVQEHPEQFVREWQRKLQAWAQEVIARGVAAADEATPAEVRLPIFGVLDKAERLLDACGKHAWSLVGGQTRLVLENECCKVFARLAGIQTYRLGNSESNYRLMKSGYTPPRR
jgi:hypothetical protein